MEHTTYDNLTLTKISKTMSWILRHGLNELKLNPDELGRIPLDTLLELDQIKNINCSKEIIMEIISNNSKQRFRLDLVNGIEMIGANQGHSMEIGKKINNDKLMTKITKPLNLCVHGTYLKCIEEIKKTGLKTMNRTHIHFASDYPNNKKIMSGARTNSNVFIEIDMTKAMGDGIIFYLSSNGVILSNGIDGTIDPKYFSNIIYKTKQET